MILYRKIEKKLKEWLNSNYALLLVGARQVGKTFALKKFISDNFENSYYLNLFENVQAIKTIINANDTDDFILRLSALSTNDLVEGCCIFIDEIQEYYTYLSKHPEIEEYFDLITGIKFLVEKNKYRIVYSGSLLRLEIENIISNPVGYVLPLEMYPLDFEEFLIANSINKNLIEIVKNAYIEKKPVPEYIHNMFIDLFYKYLLVGGMPNAVSEYIDKNTFSAVENAHKTIDYFIRQDITKYSSIDEKLKIKEIYNLIPTELNSMSKRFIASHISGHKKNDNESLSFTWLNNAGVTIPVYVASEPVIPLKASSKRNSLKLFHEDVGILTYLLLDAQSKTSLLNKEVEINYGAVFENVVAQLLYAHGFSDLYFYNNKKNGEVDFLIEQNGKVLPIEVKSGKSYDRHRGINNIMAIDNYHIEQGYVLYGDNYKHEGKLHYMPIYFAEFIRNRAL